VTEVFELAAADGPAPGHERELALYGRLIGASSSEGERQNGSEG
jgi:hypothetical protein